VTLNSLSFYNIMVPWRWRPKSISNAPTQRESQDTTDDVQNVFQRNETSKCQVHPKRQSALLLQAIRQPYEVVFDHAVPEIQHDTELLVKVTAVGLNPIDWKAP
jgi:hypothetical protein